jgi:hypothetical protein
VITAEAADGGTRAHKQVTTLATRITNQDGVTVQDGSAVVWRDPTVADWVFAEVPGKAAGSRTS